MVARSFRALGFPHRMMAILTKYEMINVRDTVSAQNHHLRMSLFTDFLFEKRTTQGTLNTSLYEIYMLS